jgi:hypothetical protein
MEPGPSRFAEAVVGFLLPPAAREHVLGDLCERYISPLQYFADALSTVPLVIVSRIRRTADTQVLLMHAFALYLSFLSAAWCVDWRSLAAEWGLLRPAIPSAIALVFLVLADAYANPAKRSRLRPVRGAVLAVGLAFASQAILAAGNADLAEPRPVMIRGGGIGLLLVATLRLLFPPFEDRPQGATGPAFWLRQTLEPIQISRRTSFMLKCLAAVALAALIINSFRR